MFVVESERESERESESESERERERRTAVPDESKAAQGIKSGGNLIGGKEKVCKEDGQIECHCDSVASVAESEQEKCAQSHT